MDRTVTVSLRTMATTVAVAVALVAAYLLGSGNGGAHAATVSKASTGSVTRTVGVSGTGTATAVPDQIGFSVDITQTRASVNAAFDAAAAIEKKAVASLKANGVNTKDIQTSGISTEPVYSYKRGEPPTLKGYRVSQQLSVTVDGVRQGGSVISNVITDLGASARIEGVQLQVSNPDKYLAKARLAALASAKSSALQYAKAAGGSLGQIVSISEGTDDNYSPGYDSVAGSGATAGAAPAALPIQAGESDLSITVDVVWALN